MLAESSYTVESKTDNTLICVW